MTNQSAPGFVPRNTRRNSRSPAAGIDDVEARIRSLAERQHGVVARAQLLRAGVTVDAIDYRLSRQRLRPIFRGVYGTGPLGAPHAREMAAVLASGEGALLSHLSAVGVWRLASSASRTARVDVETISGFRAPSPVIRLHRTTSLHPDDAASRHGIPITSVARTLVDVAGILDQQELERAVALALRSGLTTTAGILQTLERHPRRRGAPVLRSILQDGPALTRSEAEERFVTIMRDGGLPVPEVNAILHGYEVDCLWRPERVVVEIDGYAFHGSRAAFERDRARDAALIGAGYRVLRFSWRQLTRTPARVLVSVAKTMAGAPGGPARSGGAGVSRAGPRRDTAARA